METDMTDKQPNIAWLNEPQAHDYPAAQSYLGLIYENAVATTKVHLLQSAAVTRFKAKDIFRASGLSLLGISNTHVDKDRSKIAAAQALSPLLLIRDPEHGKVVVADGYHRLCAVYAIDEDAMIPCKIV